MSRLIFILFAIILLIYLLIPGPSSINDFPGLPNSAKSNLPGDTVQVPNVSGYFSDNFRAFVTNFYKMSYKSQVVIPFLPIRLNYPPEFAYTTIKDQTRSTYLEEYVYPLRDSLFINGYEPFYENGKPKFFGSVKSDEQNDIYYNKTTLRFYPSSIWVRVAVWLGILASVYLIWTSAKRVIHD
ncbi:MAG: hypothetical protein WCV81_02070 [Microgenomates group bacterium]|jgi:hypothetical protein